MTVESLVRTAGLCEVEAKWSSVRPTPYRTGYRHADGGSQGGKGEGHTMWFSHVFRRQDPLDRTCTLALIAGSFLALLLFAGTSQAQERVVVAVQYEANVLDPRMDQSFATRNVLELVYAPLLVWNESYEIEPIVARAIETPDETTFVFHLREGVLFHDGVELTSEDVAYTYDTLRDPEFGSPLIGPYRIIERIETPDRYTVEFHLREPSAAFLTNLILGIVPKHYVEEHGDEHLGRNPLGAGGFVFVEQLEGEEVRLRAFDDYFEGRPAIDELVMRFIPDRVTRTIELELGAADVMTDIDPEDLERLDAMPELRIQPYFPPAYCFLVVNQEDDVVGDLLVRQAMAHVMPLEDAAILGSFGAVPPAEVPMPFEVWAYEPDVPRYEFNPEAARALLAEAGYDEGVSIEMVQLQGGPRPQIAQIIQQTFALGGIDLTITPVQVATGFERLDDGDFQAQFWCRGLLVDPDRYLFPLFHSDQVPPMGQNWARYNNPRVDELLEQGRRITDQERRQEIYSEVQKILMTDLPFLPVYYQAQIAANSARLDDYSFDPSFLYRNLIYATFEE